MINLEQPIHFQYPTPTDDLLKFLGAGQACVEVKEENRFILDKTYLRMGIKGASEKVYLRAAVLDALKQAVTFLPEEYGFVIFDAFRNRETQKGLFDSYYTQIAEKNPEWSEEQLHLETRKFVAHPDEPSRFEVPPHLSGGAVDLGLTLNGYPADMGTSFDDLTGRAATNYFESSIHFSEVNWIEIQKNRRLLFNSMREAGFTNWKHEWWHYDLGNCLWAQEVNTPWVYGYMLP